MNDPFELLGFDPLLAIDDERLRAAYDEQCRTHHPDRGGEADRFAAVQQAYETLRDPGRRLRAWVEHHGSKVGAVQDEETMSFFTRVGELVGRVDEVLQRKEEARSALAKALAEKGTLSLLAEVEGLRAELGKQREGIVARFAEFDERGASEGLAEAAEAAGRWVFLERWDGQLRERWIRLGM